MLLEMGHLEASRRGMLGNRMSKSVRSLKAYSEFSRLLEAKEIVMPF